MPTAGHLLTDTITVSAFTGVNASGDPTFGAQSTKLARVEAGYSRIIDINGNERQSTHTVVTESAIGIEDRVWLPGDDTADTQEGKRPVAIIKASIPGSGGYTLFETRF
jgi:hypothetical protein